MTKVIDLQKVREKKVVKDIKRESARRLYKKLSEEETKDFGDRLARIRKSLDRINRLMSELKNISDDTDSKTEKRQR